MWQDSVARGKNGCIDFAVNGSSCSSNLEGEGSCVVNGDVFISETWDNTCG